MEDRLDKVIEAMVSQSRIWSDKIEEQDRLIGDIERKVYNR